jgi:hypothetical protein
VDTVTDLDEGGEKDAETDGQQDEEEQVDNSVFLR